MCECRGGGHTTTLCLVRLLQCPMLPSSSHPLIGLLAGYLAAGGAGSSGQQLPLAVTGLTVVYSNFVAVMMEVEGGHHEFMMEGGGGGHHEFMMEGGVGHHDGGRGGDIMMEVGGGGVMMEVWRVQPFTCLLMQESEGGGGGGGDCMNIYLCV